MKYLKLFESIVTTNIPDTDEYHSISFQEWSTKRGYANQENWTDWEVEQLKEFAKKYDETGSCSNRRIGSYMIDLHYDWGRLLVDKSKDEWYLVSIEFWKNSLSPDKPYWICDQFDNLLELLDHLSNNLKRK
jgi:tRNA splicing ligase